MDFRTDLAVERRDVFRKINKISQEIPGIESEEKQISDTIHVYNVRVKDDEGAQAIQKPIGNYVTIDVRKMRNITNDEKDKIAETLTLAVNDVQAEKLVAAEYSGKIHAVFERRGG